MDILWKQLQCFLQQYQVPGSNVTIDEAMILFTGRLMHITMMPIKPISQRYKFFCMAEKGYVWEFHPSSNAVGGDPVDVESRLVQLTDTQLISRCNWYPLFYWILETALINSLIIYQDLPFNKENTVEHFDFRLSIVRDLLQAGSPSTMKSSSRIPASQEITRSAPATQSAFPPLPTKLVTKHTPLPLC